MKIERSKNATRNVFFGIILNIYNMIIPFVTRTTLIYVLGMQYLGLNSLFASVLSVLNLAELGVGSAMVFSMYKPIAEDDSDKICALMKLYRTYYRIIGSFVLVAGLIVLPFIKHFISGDVPDDINVYVLYAMNLASTVISYWLFAYKNSLLNAHQRIDVSKKIQFGITTAQFIVQIGCLFAFHNYYIYTAVIIVASISNNLITAYIVDKKYPNYHPKGEIEKKEKKKINKRIADLFTSRIGGVVVDQSDTIIISAFLGLTTLGIYQNYYFILTTIYGFLTIILASCTAGIGNSLITETPEKNYNDLKKLTLIMLWLGGFCSSCLACLYQPFMELWVGKENMLDNRLVICFAVYFFVRVINQLLCTFKDAGGIWHEDRFRPLVVGLANLTLNLILVQYIGLYGILLSTILSMLFVGQPWLFYNLFTVLFHKGAKEYILKVLMYCIVATMSVALCILTCNQIKIESNILTIIVRLIVCAIIPNVLFFALFFKTNDFKGSISVVDNVTKHKIKLLKRFM